MNLKKVEKQLQIDLGQEDVTRHMATGLTLCKEYFPDWENYSPWLKEVLINAHDMFSKPFIICVYNGDYSGAADALGTDTKRNFRLASRLRHQI